MDAPTPDPPKRKRGRPRKTPPPPVEPEDILFAPEPEPPQADEEIINLPRDPEPEPEPEPAPAPAPAPAQAEPAVVYLQPAVDEAKERARRQAVLQRLRKYREAFVAVRAMPFDENASTDALEAQLDNVRAAVSSKNLTMLVKGVYLAGVKGIEVVTSSAGAKTYGLTDILAQSAEIDGLLKECACELGVGHIPAHIRLAMATTQAVLVLDSTNRRAEALAGFKSAPVTPELKSRYGDL